MASMEDTAKSTQDCGTDAGSSKQESCEQHPETESSEYIGNSRKRSKVWLHFVKTDNLDKAKCVHCEALISCRTRHGPTTSAMLNHISTCKLMPRKEADSESDGKKLKQLTLFHRNQVDDFIGSRVPSHKTFSQPASRKALVEMIIMDELPFRFVEHRGFRRFMSVLQPRFEIPCRQAIARDCLRLYEDERGKFRKFFRNYKGSICLTTDCWTSIQNLSYMVEQCCSFWGIRRVFTITVDNASLNDLALKYLKKKLTSWGTTFLGGEFLHMRCGAHILSLIVKDGLQEAHGSIFRIRSAVRYVRSSPGRLKRFKERLEIQKVESKAGLCLDVETRWNSTFLMLQATVSLKKGFDMLEVEDDKYVAELSRICNAQPSESDWLYASALTEILQYFYDATVNISGSKYVTGNTYMKEIFGVGWMIVKMDTAEDEHKRAMAEKMRLKFYKYWGNFDNTNMMIYVAAVLDPRYKMRWVKWMIEGTYPPYEAKCLVDKIIDALNRLFAYYLSLISQDAVIFSQENSEPPSKEKKKRHALMDEMFDDAEESEGSEIVKSELDSYLDDIREDRKNPEFRILNWWKTTGSKYKVLSLMARDLLAILVSSVASESAFSTGGRMLDRFRSSLTPRMVEALICTQDWYCDDDVDLYVEELLNELENIESAKGWKLRKEVFVLTGEADTEQRESSMEL